ncbi:MAG TPA: PAS domain S-box protein [Nodosilinea sp.]|nr:PAS domain S-box protein [Nodosilinea sp.]
MDNERASDKTKAELLAEIQTLRDRLTTSEETLRAIQGGEVDALVVSTPDGPRIFTLQTADQSYRLLVEEMQQGAAILSAEGLILYGNQSLANLLQRPLEQLIGTYFRQFLSLQDGLLFQSRTGAMAPQGSNTLELFLIASNAVEIPVYMTISALNVNETVMTCVVITDLTQQKRHEETLAAERLARLMLEQAGEAILVCDADGLIMRASQVAYELWGPQLIGQPFDSLGLVPAATRDTAADSLALPPAATRGEAPAPFAIASTLRGASVQGIEVELEDQRGQRLNLILSARPLADADNQRLGAVVLLTDITPRKRIETQRLQALAELSRAKAELEQRVAERTVELRQLNEHLQQSESTLRSFFDSAVMPMGIVELHGNDILHLSDNGAAAGFFGTTPQAMQNRLSSDLGIPVATIERWIAYYREAERTQAPVRFEYCHDNPKGARWLSGSVCPIAVSPSGRSRFSYIIEDITERKQAEATLARREEQLRLTIDFTHIGTWDWDLQQGTVIWNDNHFKLLGLDPTTADPYQSWRNAIHPDDLADVEQALQDALQQHTDYEKEYRVVYPDGTLRWIVGRGRGLYDASGKPTRMLGVIIDISERKQAEQTQEFQAVITRNMAEGICVVRADNGIIAYANRKFEQMFGYDPGELDGQPVSIVNYATDTASADSVTQTIHRAVLDNKETTYEVHNVKKDGTPFWCSATTSIFAHPEYGVVLVAVQQDISDRKESEAKLQTSLKEKDLLLKEIYHRVKNNLQVIYSLLNLQSRKVADPLALSVLRDSQSRVRAMALVHEKLYKSQDLARIDLADYIQSLAYSLLETYRTGSHRIALRLEIEPYSLDIETALPCGLMLTELLSNSLKYAFPDGRPGEIAILSSVDPDHQISLQVQDNGVGLPDGFDLQQMSSLGLSLVQNLAKQIKGDVVFLPQPVGCAFQITFPV